MEREKAVFSKSAQRANEQEETYDNPFVTLPPYIERSLEQPHVAEPVCRLLIRDTRILFHASSSSAACRSGVRRSASDLRVVMAELIGIGRETGCCRVEAGVGRKAVLVCEAKGVAR